MKPIIDETRLPSSPYSKNRVQGNKHTRNIVKRVNFLFIFIITGLIVQLFWEGWLWSLVVSQPETHKPVDFSSLYTAGRIAAISSYHLVYDGNAELQVQETIIGEPLQMDEFMEFIHPPLLVPILRLINSADYIATYWRWVMVLFIFVAGSLVLIQRILQSMQWKLGSQFLLIIAAVSFYPVYASLLKGQDSAFLLLGVMLWFYGMLRGKDWLAGLGLALTLLRPQVALILAVPFLFSHRKIGLWFAGGGIVLVLYSGLLIGVKGVQDFIHVIFTSSGGQSYGMNEAGMFNFTGLVVRIFPKIPSGLLHGIAWAVFLAILICLCILWRINSVIRIRHIILSVCLSVFAAPHLHFHDLALLLIPILGVIILMGRKGQVTDMPILSPIKVLPTQAVQPQVLRPVAFLLAASLLLLFAEVWDPTRYTIPYLLMAIFPVLAWKLEKPSPRDTIPALAG